MPSLLKGPLAPKAQPDDRLEPEYRPHFAAWKASPSPATAGNMLRVLEPVIRQNLKAYGGRNAGPTLHSHARRITLDALKTYDPRQGALKTHLGAQLQGLQRHQAKQLQLVSVPERVAMDRQLLDASERELVDLHGRAPSDSEIADHSGMSLKRIAYVRRYRGGFAEGQVEGFGATGDGEDADGTDFGVVQDEPIAAKALFIYHELDPVNQAILDHGFGLHGRRKLAIGAIARKLNLSSSALSQRAQRLQRMLDEVEGAGVF